MSDEESNKGTKISSQYSNIFLWVDQENSAGKEIVNSGVVSDYHIKR
jgi:hypothetical protein